MGFHRPAKSIRRKFPCQALFPLHPCCRAGVMITRYGSTCL